MQKIFFKRWLPAVLLLCIYSFTQGQEVKKLEYFFDADPGVGNGTTITLLSPSLSIDSTFTFDVSSLSNGLHMLYIRSQDISDNWSLNYSTSFIKTNGSDGILSIVKLEYFVDTDPGFGNATNIPITSANVIDSSFDFFIPDNGAGTRYLAIRAMDSRGQWSLIYDDTIDMCNLYKARPNFSWIRYADLFSFIDSSQNNPTHKLLWRFGNLGTDSVSNPQFTFPQGNYYTTLIAGEGCRKDSVSLPLFVGLESYYPDTAYAGTDLGLSLYGGGLDTNITVTLNNNSGGILTPYEKISRENKLYIGIFDLHTASTGSYDITLHFQNGYDTTITNGLTVLQSPQNLDDTIFSPDIDYFISGPAVTRINSVFYPELIVTNKSPVLAKGITVWLAGDSVTNWRFKDPLNIYVPDTLLPYIDSIPADISLDSLNNQPFNSKAVHFVIPYILPYSSITIPLREVARAHEGDISTIYYWTSKNLFGSPITIWWRYCFLHAFNIALSTVGLFIPPVAVANCVSQLGQWFLFNFPQYAADLYYHKLDVYNFIYTLGSAILGCIPGATLAKAIKSAALIVKAIIIAWEGGHYINGLAATDISNNTNQPCYTVNDEKLKQDEKVYKSSVDPNQLSGPAGWGTPKYIYNDMKFNYSIEFENKPTASANAQRVYIYDTLDKTKFDLSTFELTGIEIADSFYIIPPYRKEYTNTFDLRPSKNLMVRANIKLDTASGVLSYAFLSIDPQTKDTIPQYDIRGFLPPDVDDSSGLGMVSYSIKMKTGLPHGTEFKNKATIIFDNNESIQTDPWINTLDIIPPTGGVDGGIVLNDTTALLHFGGVDQGAGIYRYNLYGAQGDSSFSFMAELGQDTIRFTGDKDSTYHFYAIPIDSVGNFATKAPNAEYSITFAAQAPLPVTLISFTAQKQQSNVQCTWQTASEINFSHYVVERSLDGSHFKTAGIITAQEGTGINNYQFIDVNAINRFSDNKKLFYRLRMVDIDSTSRYSRIVRLDFDKKYTVVVYPNPANNELFVEGIQHYHSLEITDISGRVVISKTVTAGQQTLNISTLNNGVYILRLSGNDDVQSIRFIKQSNR